MSKIQKPDTVSPPPGANPTEPSEGLRRSEAALALLPMAPLSLTPLALPVQPTALAGAGQPADPADPAEEDLEQTISAAPPAPRTADPIGTQTPHPAMLAQVAPEKKQPFHSDREIPVPDLAPVPETLVPQISMLDDTGQRLASDLKHQQRADRNKRLKQRREEIKRRAEQAAELSQQASTAAVNRALLSGPARTEGHFTTRRVIQLAVDVVIAPQLDTYRLAQALGHYAVFTQVVDSLTAVDLYVASRSRVHDER